MRSMHCDSGKPVCHSPSRGSERTNAGDALEARIFDGGIARDEVAFLASHLKQNHDSNWDYNLCGVFSTIGR